MKPSREIRDLVLGFLLDFSNGDPFLLDLFSTEGGAIHIGTDQAEYFSGGLRARAIFRQQLGELGQWKFEPAAVEAFEEGTVGWASSRFMATFRTDVALEARCTFVFHREAGAWKLVQVHKSFPTPNTAIGLPLTTTIDELAESVDVERPDLLGVASAEGTVTIMFTDVESSTATNEAMGDDAFLPVIVRHNDIMATHVDAGGGSIVKSMGDGFMVAFPSARRAVECATNVQREIAEVGPIKVRMGLHTGEPQRRADDFYGRDVAYAARLGSAATGGEILVSALVRSLVEPSGSVVFADSRVLELKGFDGPQTVHVVDWGASP